MPELGFAVDGSTARSGPIPEADLDVDGLRSINLFEIGHAISLLGGEGTTDLGFEGLGHFVVLQTLGQGPLINGFIRSGGV